ncbi:MAG: hypothetical protein KJ060_11080 [Candidatus Hydrogenedentes bacterium]|nr:hypothetical protein [Candidatus Hydrogenedentota bacterium]
MSPAFGLRFSPHFVRLRQVGSDFRLHIYRLSPDQIHVYYGIETARGEAIMSAGQQGAAMSLESTDLETASLSTNPSFLDLIERSRASVRSEGALSSEEMRRRFETEP